MTELMDATTNIDTPKRKQGWIGPACMVLCATLIGVISLGIFCYAWGLNFQDEGWAQPADAAERVNRTWLIVSVVGVVISTFLFWFGLIRLTRKK